MVTMKLWLQLCVVLCGCALAASAAVAESEAIWSLLQGGGQVVVMRHASTERGIGDPAGFQLNDCRTQRNLSPAGRQEADVSVRHS
jgi:hypothetical protein